MSTKQNVQASQPAAAAGQEDVSKSLDLLANKVNIALPKEEIEQMVAAGLSLEEVAIVAKKRNVRNSTCNLRMSVKELKGLDWVVRELTERGYINEGRTDAIVWLCNHFAPPAPKQQALPLG